MIMNIKHGETYCCRRLRLLEYLLNKGFEPYKVIPDSQNWRYKNWLFKNSAELESTITGYFANKKPNNSNN